MTHGAVINQAALTVMNIHLDALEHYQLFSNDLLMGHSDQEQQQQQQTTRLGKV